MNESKMFENPEKPDKPDEKKELVKKRELVKVIDEVLEEAGFRKKVQLGDVIAVMLFKF